MRNTSSSAPATPAPQPYVSPSIETFEVAVEKGFADSEIVDPQKQEDYDFWT